MDENLISHNPGVRKYRPKGFDKKRILQAVLLLAICMWLLYLINKNHKHESDNVHTENLSISNFTSTLGRKGLTEYTTGANAGTHDKNALEELQSGKNTGRDYEIDVNTDEDAESISKLGETIAVNGKYEATEVESLLKRLSNISVVNFANQKYGMEIVNGNGEDVLRVEAFPDENGIPPDASYLITSALYEPRRALRKNLDTEYTLELQDD